MELEISVLSNDTSLAVEQARQLKNDIEFYAPGVEVEQQRKSLNKDDAAFNLLDAAVKVFLGKDFIEKVLSIVQTWVEKKFESKKSKIELTTTDESGAKRVIIIENVNDVEKLKELAKMFEPQKT